MSRLLKRLSHAMGRMGPGPNDLTSLIISTTNDSPGALNSILSCFVNREINLARIESKFNDPLLEESGHTFMIDVVNRDKTTMDQLIEDLKQHQAKAEYVGGYEAPWFPKSRKDLDFLDQRLMEAGEDLQANHPGFHDVEYRKRRKEIADIAYNYRISHGPVPKVTYTAQEIEAWKLIYETLQPLHEKYACDEFNSAMIEMKKNCGYSSTHIPQLADINSYLAKKTGFLLRPVAGLLTGRDFLNSLAYRVFSSTQYIRHPSVPFYTPEPDIVHELLGHAPLFANRDFANFSQEIGLASLGASDAEITKLASCYWYSVEFGLIDEGSRRIYGAGVLSSVDEIHNAMSSKAVVRPFDSEIASTIPYPVTTLQPMYLVARSFKEMKELMRKYALGINRGFSLTYNRIEHSVKTDRFLHNKKLR